MNSLRKSGINAINGITWGTHISYLYSAKEDFKKVLAPYIDAGLQNNELCIWIYSQNVNLAEAEEIIKASVKNVEYYICTKQLILLPYTEWYIHDNSFNELRLNQQWSDLIKLAQDNGFDGLRASGDTAWLERCFYRDFEQYEKNINVVFKGLPFIALCLYDINRVSVAEVADIVNNHSLTIVADGPSIKIIKNTELLVKEKELAESKRMLDEMHDYDLLRTEFISNISHELRTPLNVILSTIQLLNQLNNRLKKGLENDNIKLDKYINIMKQNCYRQMRLVNNLIDISKMDSDFYELHLQVCNIVDVVENITMSVAQYIENKGLTLEFDTDTEEIYCSCDPDQIERIILNLFSNSIKFTEQGGNIYVNINKKNEKVYITVKDTGEGIPRDKLDYIFDRFHQVDASLARKREGSGIGLSLVKSLVMKHNGVINTYSELGKGTKKPNK